MNPIPLSSAFSRREAIRTIVFSSSALLASGISSKAAELPAKDFGKDGLHFLAVGDFGSGKEGQIQVAKQMNAFAGKLGAPLTAVLALGDNFYDHLEPARFKRDFEDMYSKEHLDCPFYACLGNHDYGPGYDSKQGRAKADMQLEYASSNPTSRWKMPAKWYTVDFPSVGTPLVKIIYLDSNFFEGALTPQEKLDQKRWLEAELQKKTEARWTWVVSHYPVFSDTTKRGDNKNLIKNWGGYLQQNPVSLYISGHDHNLQHLQVNDYQPSFLVSGGGGAKSYEITGTGRGFSRQILGFNHIHVTKEKVTVQLIDGEGNLLHAFERDPSGAVKVLNA
ncbi:MAG TPA: metallophosphoesterase [Luteolibacter sp.]|nr:metallophosphoesterase [Luteolibacter sp.]